MNMDRASAAALEQSQTLYCPVPAGEALGNRLAKRPASLEGLKIGFLGNLKLNGFLKSRLAVPIFIIGCKFNVGVRG